MTKVWNSVAFRLALMCGGLVLISVMLFSAVLYVGTVGVLSQEADSKIVSITAKLNDYFDGKGPAALRAKIDQSLADSVDADTEIYLLLNRDGQKVVGNVAPWKGETIRLDKVTERSLLRDDGRRSIGRVLVHRLPDGSLLMVGRDMNDLREITRLIFRALEAAGSIAVLLAIGGTLIFRHVIERRIRKIRYTALAIESGNLSLRIPDYGHQDEFSRLGNDLNRMLDRIEHLMEGVRHVSNVIAHNLRTPLGRIRAHLDESFRGGNDAEVLAREASFAIDEVDGLVTVLDKLLQIAEAESGTRRQPFELVDLDAVITNVADLYDAAAEAEGINLAVHVSHTPKVLGDKDLIASAVSNLLDNAFKYAGKGASIIIDVFEEREGVVLQVHDNGPGIPSSERDKVLQRFYRLDREQPGYGLGLSIVSAIALMHGATFSLEDAAPGLLARFVFPSNRKEHAAANLSKS
ncbi:MAG: HAMP domain-containing histidine kinase [Rhodocyclaceae bacterium]|nr:MAG: HAMP domain-containing histidine kinase [Rhodocyclaceae bacterium]